MYLVYKVFSHLPQALDLHADMPSLDEGVDINLPRLKADVEKVKVGLKQLTALQASEEKRVAANAEGSANAMENIKAATLSLASVLSKGESQLAEATEDFRKIACFFGEDPESPKTTTQSLFGTIKKFITSINDALRVVHEKVAKAERLAKANQNKQAC